MPLLDEPVAEAVSDLNSVRLARGLSPVEADTVLCSTLRRGVRRSLADSEGAVLTDADWTMALDRAVPDWEKHCFHVEAESLSGVGVELWETPVFVEAALSPEATHVALAVGDQPGGGTWCAGCIVQRLIQLGQFSQWFTEGWGGAWVFCGVSQYRHLRLTLSRDAEDPAELGQVEYSEELEADETGRFDAWLPVSQFEPGVYVMLIYVRDESGDYREAIKTYIQMPGF